MDKPDLLIDSAFLATKTNPRDKKLACGSIPSGDNSDSFLFYLVEIATEQDTNAGKKIVQVLTNSAKATPSFSDAMFEKTLGLINETLFRLSETTDSFWIGNLNAIIGLIKDDEMMISQAGKITGYIFRKNKISSLTDQTENQIPHPGRSFMDITSGQITVNDQLIFGNEDLFNHISVDRIRNLTQIDNARQETAELNSYLKKAKVYFANAVIIAIGHGPRAPELPQTLYLDEPDETFLDLLNKKFMPIAKKLGLLIVKFSILFWKHSKIVGRKMQKDWKEKYGPKSKQFLKESESRLRNSLSKNKLEFDNLAANDYSPIKIKAVPYSRSSRKISLWSKMPWEKLGFFKRLFAKRNRKILYALILILVISIGYTKIKINNEKRSEKISEIEAISAYDQAKDSFAKAREDLLLGKNSSLDPFYSSLALAEKATTIEANADNANKLIKEINDLLDEKTKTVRFYDPSMFTIGQGIGSIVLIGSEIYGINPDGKIYAVDTRDQTAKLVGSIGQDDGKVLALSYAKSSNSILISTDQQKILSFDILTKTVGKLSNADSLWKGTLSLSTYSTNIYGLDPDDGTVWKYTYSSLGYSKATDYTDTRKISLKDAVGLAVDGNIYVLRNDGQVVKFIKGAYEEDFSLKGIPAPNNTIDTPAQIFTDEDTNGIYILDKNKNRIVKFDKAGDFSNQYVFDSITIESFAVNAKLQKVWVLSNGKIWEGNL